MRASRGAIVGVAGGVLVPLIGWMPAHAAFPGANGRLVFQLERPAGDHTQADIYTVRPDGSGLRRLTATPDHHEFGPAWNASGTKIVFWRTAAPFGPGSIWTMAADGTHQRRLTSGLDARDPVWDPTGKQIAFTRVTGTNFDLWTMRASDGRGRRALTSGPALDFEPAWSPGGRQIAFTRGSAQGDPGDIYVLDVGSRKATRVTRSPAYDHQVGWAPHAKRLVFERDLATSSSIFTVSADGSGLVRLTRGAFFDTGPAFSPDQRFIAFGSDRAGAFLGDLWIMRSSGAGLHRLRRLPFGEGFPDWQPTRK